MIYIFLAAVAAVLCGSALERLMAARKELDKQEGKEKITFKQFKAV